MSLNIKDAYTSIIEEHVRDAFGNPIPNKYGALTLFKKVLDEYAKEKLEAFIADHFPDAIKTNGNEFFTGTDWIYGLFAGENMKVPEEYTIPKGGIGSFERLEREISNRELTLEEVIKLKNECVKIQDYGKAAEYRDLEAKFSRIKERSKSLKEFPAEESFLTSEQIEELHNVIFGSIKTAEDLKKEQWDNVNKEEEGRKYEVGIRMSTYGNNDWWNPGRFLDDGTFQFGGPKPKDKND